MSTNYIDKLVSTGFTVRQSTKLVNQVTKICDQFIAQLQDQSIPTKQWNESDKPALLHSLQLVREISALGSQEPSQLKNIDRYQLDQIERNLKDDINAVKSAVQLDISLEERRNDSNSQEIHRICRECIAYASLQSQQSQKRLNRVERSATTAICTFAGLLATSFFGYCIFFKQY